jgi:hypothetical protein
VIAHNSSFVIGISFVIRISEFVIVNYECRQ